MILFRNVSTFNNDEQSTTTFWWVIFFQRRTSDNFHWTWQQKQQHFTDEQSTNNNNQLRSATSNNNYSFRITITTFNNNTGVLTQVWPHARRVFLCLNPSGRHVAAWRSRTRLAAKAAPSALVVATRAADGGCGAGYSDPPLALQGGHCVRRLEGPDECHQHQGGTCRVLWTLLGRWRAHRRESGQRHCRSPGRRGRWRGMSASGTSWSIDSMFLCCTRWSSCRTSSSSLPRSHRWLPSRLSKCRRSSWTGLRSGWGIICASCRWWNSWCMCRLSCLILRSSNLLPSRSSTFQFRVEMEEGSVEVFKVLSQDRIQQHCTLSRPLTFQFRAVEVFKALAQGRVQQPLHLTLVLLMALGKGFFALFPSWKKSAGLGPHSGSELGADFAPWTPAAYGAPMVAEPLIVAELEDLGTWVDEFGRWWSRSEVFPGRWVMHDTTGGPVWWDEPG